VKISLLALFISLLLIGCAEPSVLSKSEISDKSRVPDSAEAIDLDDNETLGQTDLPNNYLTYLFDAWTGIAVSDEFAFRLAWGALLPALALSIWLNLKGLRSGKKNEKQTSQRPPAPSE
jgi:hypothetical protein